MLALLSALSARRWRGNQGKNQRQGMVPRAGIEPARHFCRGILSPLCLPISPPGLSVYAVCSDANGIIRGYFGLNRWRNPPTSPPTNPPTNFVGYRINAGCRGYSIGGARSSFSAAVSAFPCLPTNHLLCCPIGPVYQSTRLRSLDDWHG